ncbi:Proteasome component (PCI) domain protein [Raphanus sativus]|nr:Proteasome component (PCI) domain protein [Raphanus sativus]
MHMAERQCAEVATTFFEAFKNYDEAGNQRLIQCLNRKSISQKYGCILQNNRRTIMDDPVIRNYMEDLLKKVRTQILLKLIKPYTKKIWEGLGRRSGDVSEDCTRDGCFSDNDNVYFSCMGESNRACA